MLLSYSILVQLMYSHVTGSPETQTRWITDAAAISSHGHPASACQDKPSYRSPLDRQCKDHNKTDCMHWGLHNLEMEQVADLLRNCPVSCNVDCGTTIEMLDVTVAFSMLTNSTDFLGPSSIVTFTNISTEYMKNHVHLQVEDNHYLFLYDVELLQQKRSERRNLQARALNTSFASSLLVSVAFQALGIGIDARQFELLLISGVESDGYERALRRSGDEAFADVVLSTIDDDLSKYVLKEMEEDGRMPWVSLCLLVVGGCLVVFFTYNRQRCSCYISKKVQAEDSSETANQVMSPTTSIGQVLPPKRLILHSRVPAVVEAGAAYPSSGTLDKSHDDSIKYHADGHPFSGIVPPMILYENIDEYAEEQIVFDERHDVFPSHRAVASPILRAQFKCGKVTLDASMVFVSPTVRRRVVEEGNSRHVRSPSSPNQNEESPIYEGSNFDEKITTLSRSMPKSLQQIEGRDLDATSPLKHRRSSSPGEFGDFPNIPDHRDVATPPFTVGTRAALSYFNSNGIEPKGLFETPKSKRQKLSVLAIKSKPRTACAWPGMHTSIESSDGHDIPSSRGLYASARGERRTFQVPRYRHLGFQFSCDAIGLVVQHVKNYSPLLGKAQKGDWIISIDGWETHGATHEEASTAIARKAIPMRTQSRMMDVVVLRKGAQGEKYANDSLLLELNLVALNAQVACTHDKQATVASILRKSRFSFPEPCRNDVFNSSEEHPLSEQDNVLSYE